MTEAVCQTHLSTIIKAMVSFPTASVVINDWTIFDGAIKDVYVQIVNADDFDSRQDTSAANNRWSIVIILTVKFSDWSSAYNSFKTYRDALITGMLGVNRSGGSSTNATIDRIYNNTKITPLYDHFIAPGDRPMSDPIFLTQEIIAEVEEY